MAYNKISDDVFSLSSLLIHLECSSCDRDEDRVDRRELLIFIRCLMQTLQREDPSMYNQAKLIMEEEATKSYSSFEEAKDSCFTRLRILVGETKWSKASSDASPGYV